MAYRVLCILVAFLNRVGFNGLPYAKVAWSLKKAKGSIWSSVGARVKAPKPYSPLLLGTTVVPFFPFCLGVSLLKLNSRKKDTLSIKGLLGNLA